MKVLKKRLIEKGEYEFGDFGLEADQGWKISQTFFDYESGLLVVTTSDENKDHWIKSEWGGRIIPTKNYIIAPDNGEILSYKEWSKYFSYKTQEIISEDGKYKLITERIHETEKNSDKIKEELIESGSGKIISISESSAFRKDKRENLLELHYRQKKREHKLQALPTLTEIHHQALNKLKNRDIIINYFNDKNIFQLVYINNIFQLNFKEEKWKYNIDWSKLDYKLYKEYDTIEAFKHEFLMSKNWYLKHTPFKSSAKNEPHNMLLKKFVSEFFNELRKNHDFSYKEYDKLNIWENFFFEKDSIKPGELKQYCSNCKNPVSYYPRYPKYICSACASKKITDEKGLELSFSNIDISGGLKIIYKEGINIIKEDNTQSQKLCFIDGKRFIAEEGKFGGVVIQAEN